MDILKQPIEMFPPTLGNTPITKQRMGGGKYSQMLTNPAALLLLAASYFIVGKLGLLLASVNASATAVWLPTGITLAAFLLFGDQVWPGILLGAFLVNITTAGSIATSMSIATGNTLEGFLAAYLVTRFANGCNAFNRPQDVFKFAVLAGLASTALSATIGVTSLSLGGFAHWAEFRRIWLTWWLGDAAGALIAAPVLILWITNSRIDRERKHVLEVCFLLSLLLLTGLAVFGGLIPVQIKNYPLDFLCYPILIWTALRFGQRETATISLALCAIAIWGTLHGFGPFVMGTQNESLVLLQAFMGITAITALAVAAVVSERRSDREALWQAQAALESQIEERTAALSKSIVRLQSEINRRQEAEKDLEQKAEELLRSNTELDHFATIVSHELQEPLRKIITFGDLLKTPNISQESDQWQYVQKMENSAKRMQRLVEDILSLSRVITNAKPFEPVDLNEIIQDITADFVTRLAQAGGQINVSPLPTLKADSLQMRQLFANLISNAYKFRKKDAPLLITISCLQSPRGFIKIAVEDNGIGFDEQYLARLFKPFQRLHRKTDYEGSGMGLAICQRILMRHGGEITAKSEAGKGSIFIVTLPA